MKPLILFFLMYTSICSGQGSGGGIIFDDSPNWQSVKQKAKSENKYIFMDIYTTWCIPCQYMAKKIFTRPEVGNFFNTRFINVQVQMDTTDKDNKYVRNWYSDAKMINKIYAIDSYPTYLFFSPESELIQAVKGSSNTADEFIVIAKQALNPSTQLQTMKNRFQKGDRDSLFLITLISVAEKAEDSSLNKYIDTFLYYQKDLLTRRNISLIMRGTQSVSDIGFRVLLQGSKKIDEIAGRSKRLNLLDKIIFDDLIYPRLCYTPNIMRLGKMSLYKTDSLIRNVDWVHIQEELKSELGKVYSQVIVYAKTKYYFWLNDWNSFSQTLLNYTKRNREVDPEFINARAMELNNNCTEHKLFLEALKWASILSGKNLHLQYSNTYSILLYKAGRKEKAFKLMERYIEQNKRDRKNNLEILRKMKLGKMVD